MTTATLKKDFVDPRDIYQAPWQFHQAIKVTGGALLFVSGIVGRLPNGDVPKGDVVRQAELAYANLERVLAAAGGSMRDIVKTNVYVHANADYGSVRDALREVRGRYFTADHPATTLLQVPGFANPDYLFEIEAVAALDG
ncbi:MAG: RidA family protein [Chloroflexi bacterium]|nr:RidA family protein [Chloroflexota bacterium]